MVDDEVAPMERYPENTAANIENFRDSCWKERVESSSKAGYVGIWQSLAKAASSAIDAGRMSEGKVLWLLADAASMMLRPSSPNEPFKPWIALNTERSASPEDFHESDVDLLDQISEEIDDDWLRARLADIVWLLKRKHTSALLAIDAYRAIPLDGETWLDGGRGCWERAISLCRMLRKGSGERITEIETAMITAFDNAQREGAILAIDLATILFDNGLAKEKGREIAQKLEAWGRLLDDESKPQYARRYFSAAAEWFKRIGDKTKLYELTVCLAEGWAREGAGHSSQAVAAGFYENAIQTYRLIPKGERAVHTIDRRIAELHTLMNEAGEKSLGEMGRISSSIDISDLVESTRNRVRGKTVTDALVALASVCSAIRVVSLRETSEEMLKQHPIRSLLSSTHVSQDGRVVAKHPGMDWSDPTSESYRAVVGAEMVRNFSMQLGVSVTGAIWPALEILILEHRLREADFVSLAAQSPIVPEGRERLWGKAIFCGYEGDFVAALHLLTPQIEHMVRWHLKAAGAKTSNLDKDGIENENGLSALLELDEVAKIFGEDLTFELKALFSDPVGPNLRNEVAHGLMDYNACQSTYSIYAWWFGFRLMFISFWNARRNQNGGEEGPNEPAGGGTE
jgi:hypothetical protein